MIERIKKCLLTIVAMPFILSTLAAAGFIILTLPIIVLIKPNLIETREDLDD